MTAIEIEIWDNEVIERSLNHIHSDNCLNFPYREGIKYCNIHRTEFEEMSWPICPPVRLMLS